MAVAEENKKREDKRQAAAAGKKQFERIAERGELICVNRVPSRHLASRKKF